MNLNEYMRNNRHPSHGDMVGNVKHITCADGLGLSVQASQWTYCSPRVDDAPHYSSVEVGFPTERCESLMQYAENEDRPTDTVYGWVPIEVVEALIDEHGGIV